jgi:hypothetical protein
MNKFMHLLPAIVMLQLLLVTTTLAQNAQEVSLNVSARARTDALSQTVLNSLSSLPEADTLIFINPQRILNEAVPKLMPEKQVAEMRSTLNEIKQNVGVDPSKVEYVVVALRFRKPSADLNFMAPEVMIVAGGDFSADSLLLLARMASGGKLRDEKYGTKTLSLMTIDPLVKQAEKNPILKSYSELGIISLNATTIAAGTPAYLKAAVDAEEGRGRISSESRLQTPSTQRVTSRTASSNRVAGLSQNWIDVKAGERVAGVTITLAEGAASLRGSIQLPEGDKIPPLLSLYLVPAEKDKNNDELRFFSVPIGEDASFAIGNLPPGRYWLLTRINADYTARMVPSLRSPEQAPARAKLSAEAEAAHTEIELMPCQNATDYRLPLKLH